VVLHHIHSYLDNKKKTNTITLFTLIIFSSVSVSYIRRDPWDPWV